jgi:hypothetical protein
MSIDNKKFKNNKTGEVVQVISTFEDIAILENKQKASVRDLLNPGLYSEEIDPSSFFSNQGAYNILAERIKNIPSHMIKDDEGVTSVNVDSSYGDEFRPAVNESAIVMSSEEDERAELARKYGASMDSNSSLQKQNQAFAQILGEDDDLPRVPKAPVYQEEPVQRVEARREEVREEYKAPVQRVEAEDPIITMFKRTKRNVEFNVNVGISDKIPRLDFIEMMEDSYEISMIDFLADEFTNKILQDPSVIRETIKSKIKQLVYGSPTTHSSNHNTNKEKTKVEKGSKNIQTVNDQITDSVTQFEKHEPLSIEKEFVLTKDLPKKTTTRKPRAKKETVEK